MICSYHALVYFFMLNMFGIWDWSHGIRNDMDLTFSSLGCRAFQLLVLIVMCLPWGPEKEECMRWEQLKDVLDSMFSLHTADSLPLFSSRASRIAKEMRRSVPELSSIDPGADLWQHLKNKNDIFKKGIRPKMSHFCGWVRGAHSLLSDWTWELTKREYLAIEMDMVSTSVGREQLVGKKTVIDEVAGDVPTSISISARIPRCLPKQCCLQCPRAGESGVSESRV